MPIAAWNDSYKTGNLAVDHEHEELFKMVNELHDAVVSGHGKEVLMATLQKLAKYTVDHFAHEERLMVASKYPGYAEHKKAHDDLAQKATQIIADYQSGKLQLSMTLSRFLSDWIKSHINHSDMEMIQWVRAHEKAA